MPIVSTIEGNLIKLAQEGVYTEIAHGCNCFCVMGAGIAPQIAKAYPEAEEADNATERGAQYKLGKFSFAEVQNDQCEETMTIFNLYTQYSTKGRAKGIPDINYAALGRAFKALNDEVKNYIDCGYYEEVGRMQMVGIPMIGAGLAGGHWDTIKTIIDSVTPDIKLEVVVFKP